MWIRADWAYMTGILPIKKDGSQSAISDFKEFTVIKPRKFGDYVGFTEAEVKKLCEEIQNYGGKILLIGINYNKEALVGKRKHTCMIEKYQICS